MKFQKFKTGNYINHENLPLFLPYTHSNHWQVNVGTSSTNLTVSGKVYPPLFLLSCFTFMIRLLITHQ